MSSQDVIKSVSKKLKHYFDVKRLEDGFDLSGPDCPKLDHPPLKTRPTLMYDGLHDRPLKHYFSPHDVRVVLTKFTVPEKKQSREKDIRKTLESYMKKWNYYEQGEKKLPPPPGERPRYSHPWLDTWHNPSRPFPSSVHRHRTLRSPRSRPIARTRVSSARNRQAPALGDNFYNGKFSNRKLRREPGFGSAPRKSRSPHSGGYPVLRSTPPRQISRGEAERLMSIASRLLVASETFDLSTGKLQNDDASGSKQNDYGLPQLGNQQSRPKSGNARYSYDINGRKIVVKKNSREENDEDSAYQSPQDENDDVPRWLRKEMRKVEVPQDPGYSEQVSESRLANRPKSAFSPHPPTDTPDSGRPKSSSRQVSRSQSRSSNSSSSSSSSGSRSSDEGSDGEKESTKKKDSTEDAAAQTSRELISAYDPMESVIWDGDKAMYKVHVWTGNRLGASTRADIKVVLTGTKGRTQEIMLKDSKTHKVLFQRGQEDVFVLDTVYVGPLKMVSIGHDRSELGFGWYLEKLEVRDTTNKMLYQVPCDKWLSSREGDGVTFRKLLVASSQTYEEEPATSDNHPTAEEHSLQEPIHYEKAESVVSQKVRSESTVSHTSLDTLYSDRKDVGGFTSRSNHSTSTGSATTDSSTGSSSQSSQRPKTSMVRQDRPLRRSDTFFDVDTPKKDYASVIDSISTTEDSRERAKDFEREEDDDETGRLTKADVAEDDHLTKDTVTLSYASPGLESKKEDKRGEDTKKEVDGRRAKDEHFDRFKAGREVAKERDTMADEKDTSGEQAGLNGMTIHQAAGAGNLEHVRSLIDQNPHLKMSQDERGWNPLHVAVYNGMTDVVKWLAAEGTRLDDMTPAGYTAMHLAAMKGFTNVMMVLGALGAKTEAKSVENKTPLHVAAMSGHLETCKWLVANRAALDSMDNFGRKPLDLAEENEHSDVADFFRSCEKELQQQNASTSLIRSNSKSSVNIKPDDSASNAGEQQETAPTKAKLEDDNQSTMSKGQKKKKETSSSSSSSGSSDTESQGELPKAAESMDEHLMEKKKLYDDQQKRQVTRKISFLDSIRDEVNNE